MQFPQDKVYPNTFQVDLCFRNSDSSCLQQIPPRVELENDDSTTSMSTSTASSPCSPTDNDQCKCTWRSLKESMPTNVWKCSCIADRPPQWSQPSAGILQAYNGQLSFSAASLVICSFVPLTKKGGPIDSSLVQINPFRPLPPVLRSTPYEGHAQPKVDRI